MIYLIVLLIFIIELISTKKIKKRNKLYLVMSVLLGIIFAFRGTYVGTDTYAYSCLYFKNLDAINISNGFINPSLDIYASAVYLKAPGWAVLFKTIGSVFGYSPEIYLFFSGLIVTFIICFVLYKFSEDPLQSLFFYYLILFIPSLNGTRTFIAISLLFLSAFLLLKDKKYISFFLIIIACTIHKTAIIGFGIYAIFTLKWTVKRLRILFSCATVGSVSIGYLSTKFTQVFSEYSDTLTLVNDAVGGKNIVYQVAYICIAIYAYHIIKRKRITNYIDVQKAEKLLIITVIEIIIGIVGFQTWYLQRINFYFQIFVLVLIPQVFLYKYKYGSIIKIIVNFVFTFGFLYMIYTNNSNVVPYSIWLFKQ